MKIKISEIERLCGISSQTIRYYENRGLISVGRQDNGYREYSEDILPLLRKIRFMRSAGISLADIKLWRDNVVTEGELMKKRLSELDESDRILETQRRMCEAGVGDRQGSELFDDSDSLNGCVADIDAPLALGIDIGTTTISAQLIDLENGLPLQTYSITHNASIELPEYPDAYAADAALYLDRVCALVNSLCGEYSGIEAIGISGQMHGIVCLDENGEPLSPLYSWQNQFGQREINGHTLCEALEARCSEQIPTGFGLMTYYCLSQLGLLPERTASIATIMDAAVMRLCGNNRPSSHATNAASLGLFDIRKNRFRLDRLSLAGIPEQLLPEVAHGFGLAGCYSNGAKKIPVAYALGDNQAGIFGALNDSDKLLVNIGTSSQVSLISGGAIEAPSCAELRPYCDNRYILAASALCGGRAYSLLADFIGSILRDFGAAANKKNIYRYLNELCEKGYEEFRNDARAPMVDTRFCGTRADPTLRGAILKLSPDNFNPTQLALGTLKGIVMELFEMYKTMAPEKKLRPVLAGNALRLNPTLQRLVGDIFGEAPLLPTHTEESAFGAALYAAISAGLISEEDAANFIKYKEIN